MADDNYIEITARLDKGASIDMIQKDLFTVAKKVLLQLHHVEVSQAGTKSLQASINDIQRNLSLSIGNVSIDQSQTAKQAQQISQNLASAMNVNAKGNMSNITRALGTSLQNLNGVILATDKSIDQLAPKIQQHFQSVGNVTTKILDNSANALRSFMVQIKDSDGAIETLRYSLADATSNSWHLENGTITDNNLKNIEESARRVNTEFKTLTHYWQMMENLSERRILSKNKDSDDVQNVQANIERLNKAYSILKKHFEVKPQNPRLAGYIDELKQAIISANSEAHNLVRTLSEQQTSINHTEEVNSLKALYNNLKASDVALDEFKADYQELNVLLSQAQTTGDYTQYFTQLDIFKSKFSEAKSEIKATTAATSDLEKMVKSLTSNKMNTFFDKNSDNAQVNALKTEINGLINEWTALNAEIETTGHVTHSMQGRLDELRAKMQNATTAADTLQKNIKEVANAQRLATQKQSLDARITSWLQNNTRASQETIAKLKEMQAQIQNADHQTMTNLNNQFRQVTANARAAGEAGMKLGDVIKQKLGKFAGWFSIATVVMRSVNELKNMYREVVELDTALVDLRKTTDATNAQLEDFYFEANKIGKQLGVTTKDVIQATSEWSRLGYSIKDAQEMAKTSSIFASISPGMDIEKSTEGLVSVLKAYDIEASDALEHVVSEINAVGNSQALTNENIVDFLTRSSAAMKEAGNSFEQLVGLGTAAVEVVRDSSSVGNALKTVSMRLRGYDEETHQLSDDLKSLTGDIADLTKSAQHPMGVSLFTDETRTEYKSTYQILKDITEVYDELSDRDQAALLEKIAGKRNAQVVAAILNNFDAVDKSIETMQNSAGNAEKEMGVIMDSIEYKTNRLKETAVGIAQDIFQRDSTKNMVDNLTSLLEIINKLTTSIGGLGTAFTGLMAYKGLKGQGIFDVFGTGVSGVKGVQNFFSQPVLTQQGLDLGLTEKSISQLKQYTTLIEQGATRTQAFKQAMVGATPATKAAATEIARGNVSLNQLTTSSRAAAIGMRLFNAALNAGIMYIISIGIKALNDLAHAEENAMKAAQENVETTQAKVDEYKSQQEQIDELIEKYKALREAENNDNTQTRSQLVGLQEQVTNLVGDEANNLDLVNGRLDEQLAKLKEIKNLNFANTFESAESAYDAAVEQAETFAYHKGNSVFGAKDKNIVDMDFKNLIGNQNTQIGNEIVNQVLEELGIGSAGFNMDSFDAYYEIKFDKNTDLKQRLEATNKIIEALRVSTYDTSQDNDLYEAIKEYRNELQGVVEAQENSAKQMVDLYTQQVVDDKLSQMEISSFKEYETAKRAMIKDISRQQSIQDALFGGIISQADIENAVNNYMAGLDEVSTYYNAWLKNTTQGSQSDYEKAKSMLGLQDIVSEFDYADYKEKFDEVEKSLGQLATAYGKLQSKEMTSSDVLSLIDEFPELAPYANDMSALTDKVKELGQQTAEPLITSLNALAKNVKDPEQKASIEALVINLQKMASLSEGIKNTADAVQRVTAADYIKWEEDNIQKIIDKLDKEKDAQNEVLDSLKSQKETLEQTISDYEKVADVVGKYIDRTQIEPLNDRKTEIEEYYNTEIEKLKEENDERDRNIELQEKQDALANARKQKNRVYTETEGWVWKQNNKAIRDAQKDLTDLQNTMSIESLEKTRDAEVKNIDEQIKSWEKYKDEWKRQVEQITEADNELMASKVLGVDWQDQVASQSVNIMTTYGNEYASYNNRLKNQVEVEIAQTEKVINERDKEIEEWKDYKNDISNLNTSIETSNEAYLESLNNLVLDENSTWEDRINHLKRNVEIIKQLNAEAASANLTQFNSGMYTLYQGDELVGWGYSSEKEARREKRKLAENIAKSKIPKNAPAGVLESIIQSIMNSMVIKRYMAINRYARGGVNTTTGLSWLDGTQGSSEVVFNAAQAKQLYDIVHSGDFGHMMGENILSGLRDVLGQIKYKNSSQSTPNVLNVSFPNANINAESYESFKGFMDKYTNDLFMQLQTGKK